MARIYVDVKGIDRLASKLGSLGNQAQAAVRDMLKAGSDLMIDGLRRGCAEYGHDTPGRSGRATGGLKGSIGLKPGSMKAGRDGGSATVTFNGTDARGQRYGAIGYYLNYGTSSIPADHWIDNTVELMQPLVNEAMRQELDRYLNARGE